MLDADSNAPKGVTFELRIYAAKVNVMDMSEVVPEVEPTDNKEPEKTPAKKKGCFGGFEISLISMSMIGMMAIGVLLLDRKRKIAK